MERIAPPEPSRADLVKRYLDDVHEDLEYWEPDFERMKLSRRIARGLQWPGMTLEKLKDLDRPYVENITLRHLKQRQASIYARNPRYVFKRSPRLDTRVWDGSAGMLQQAMVVLQAAGSGAAPGDGMVPALAETILREAAEHAQEKRKYDLAGKTLAILYEWSMREQTVRTKTMMKRLVLQSEVCGVAYVKQGYQRIMKMDPEVERQIHDAQSQLATIERLSAEASEGELLPEQADMERLRQLLQELEQADKILLREGLTLDYPDPTDIIPSRDLIYLPCFLGCTYVNQRYHMTPAAVRETYKVDIGEKFRPYRKDDPGNRKGLRTSYSPVRRAPKSKDYVCVFERYDKADGLIYTMADGYDDFLRDPEQPDPWTERFWPWFVFAPNALEDPDSPYPPSDVELIEPMQFEINRAGQGLSDHRWANRPRHVTSGAMSEEDRTKLGGQAAHTVVALQALREGEKIADVLQPFPSNPIDPNLYSTGQAYQGLLRTSGSQEANLGPTTGATATESSIAESSRQSVDDSSIDELDDLLSEMAHAGGQILQGNMSIQTVKEVVGPGAVWLENDRQAMAREIYLEAEAGSSGRKNQAHEIQVRTQMLPLMFQIPNIDPETIGRDMLNVMDSRLQWEDWTAPNTPSILMMNSAMQPASQEGMQPSAQGPMGGNNAPTPEPGGQQGPQSKAPPKEPTPTA